MSDLEKLLVTALRHAWQELNAIRACDGTAYHHRDGMPYCTPEWWGEVTDMCETAIIAATGDAPKPWPFLWEMDDADSAKFVEAILNPPEPNAALRAAADHYRVALAQRVSDRLRGRPGEAAC